MNLLSDEERQQISENNIAQLFDDNIKQLQEAITYSESQKKEYLKQTRELSSTI